MTITRTTSQTVEEYVFNEEEGKRHGMSVVDVDAASPLAAIAGWLANVELAAGAAASPAL